MAGIQEQDLYPYGRLRGAGLSHRPRSRAGRPPATRRRTASTPDSDDCLQREHAVAAAAGNLDDAFRFPQSRRDQQRHGQIANDERQEVRRADVHGQEQREGQWLHQRPEPGREGRDRNRQPDARRHAPRGELHRLQGLRRREIPDQDRAEAGRLRDPRSDRDRCESKCPRRYPASAGARRRGSPGRWTAARHHVTKTGGRRVSHPSRVCRVGRRLQGLHRRDRRAPERSTRDCDHRRSQEGHPE